MKNKIGLGIIFTFSMIAFSQVSFAGRCDTLKSGQAAFFEHSKYRGTCVVRKPGRYANAKSVGIGNDKISSIKVGSRTQVRLCKDNNFRGGCKTYTRSMSSLGKMNDKTSSAIIGKTTSTTTASVSCRPRANQVVFFQHAKYRGACSVRNMGRYANAKAIGIGNDKISSIKLGSGSHVVLCKDNNFRGGCKTYTRSMSSLGKMNDKTSSAIIVKTVPQKSPPYVFEKNKTPLTKTAPLRNRGKSELPAPSSLSVDKVTSTTVTLSWFDNSDREYGVEVYRMDPVEARRNRATNWEFLELFEERIDDNVKGTGWRSDEDYDLNSDTNYCYKLRAYVGFDRSVVSDYSKLVCTKTSASNE